MAEEKIELTKRDRLRVAWRSTFIQGSWNYERMQNGGWVYSMLPAIKNYIKLKKIVPKRCNVTWNSLIHILISLRLFSA
ncbi:PTS system mannose-specific EIID component [Listeria fleischmannii subsp. fleischmannii]|uniref:PTS system mannose-specific EIID component n=1 Tax=Listeria fleischmannii subsp. fleischmannii TaxID=1671902 RepID=A0A2X3J7H2_9LIST|nr:PTS system mannose-specific EIID component [Listeria fleischmannii subsp. fleischmannii]